MGDHFLPQMLLRHFCASDGRLWVARKGQDQPFGTKPRRVFAENDLNTQHTPVANPDGTGWTFRRDRSSENALTQIEGAAADPIRQVITSARKQRLPQLGPDAQDALKRFFFATARRTPESQKRIRTPDAQARHELYVWLSRKAASEGVTLPSEGDFYAIPGVRELMDQLFRNADARMAAGMVPSVRRFEDQFFKTRALAVLAIAHRKNGFIVGSHGIAIVQGLPPGSWLPIASDVAIAYHDDHQGEKIGFLGTKEDEVIRAINDASANNSTMIAGGSRQLIAGMMARAWGVRAPSTTSSDNPLRVARRRQPGADTPPTTSDASCATARSPTPTGPARPGSR